ncbi:MAG: formate/nitrite transporter family protein [Armatimonadota bacterium]
MYVPPAEVVEQATQLGEKKVALSLKDMGVRGFLAAALLGYATALAFYAAAVTQSPLVGALVFPAGFVMLSLLGLELVTGNFALLLLPLFRRRTHLVAILRNWVVVYVAHILGGLLLAYMVYVAWTFNGQRLDDPWVQRLVDITHSKTLAYAKMGAQGWWVAFVKAVLCNWMVTLAAFLGLAARDTAGKIIAMWLPIFTFFALGFEHSVVNLFLIPAGMMMGASITAGDWWLWNQIPVTIGNIVGGALFTAGLLHWTYGSAALEGQETKSS